MGKHLQKVELHPAHVWTCDDCGRDNFVRSMDYEFEDLAEREELFRKFHHLDEFESLPADWEQFGMVTAPDNVECKHCGAKFETVRQESPFDDEDDE